MNFTLQLIQICSLIIINFHKFVFDQIKIGPIGPSMAKAFLYVSDSIMYGVRTLLLLNILSTCYVKMFGLVYIRRPVVGMSN